MEPDAFCPTAGEVYEFLQTLPHGVVATLDADGGPHATFVAFSADPELTLMFGTDAGSRKALNITRDARISFVATDPARRYTVQLRGEAYVLDEAELAAREPAHYAKHPGSLKWRGAAGQVFYGVCCTEAVFWDCNPDPFVSTLVLS